MDRQYSPTLARADELPALSIGPLAARDLILLTKLPLRMIPMLKHKILIMLEGHTDPWVPLVELNFVTPPLKISLRALSEKEEENNLNMVDSNVEQNDLIRVAFVYRAGLSGLGRYFVFPRSIFSEVDA